MKKYVLIVAGVMLIAFISSCKKFDHILYIADNCPVISHSVSGGANYQNYYTYDKNGYMSSMSFTTTFMMGTDEIVMTNTYYYKRASNGTLTGMEVESTDNTGWYSKEPIKVTYDALGRIVKLTEYYAGEPSATHQLKYNSDGLLSEHLVDMSGMPVKYIYSFEYNSIKQIKRILFQDSDGNLMYDKIYDNKGKANSNEAYMIKHGMLPFDIVYGEVFGIVNGGVGSTITTYVDDGSGNKVPLNKLTTKSITLNSKGYPATTVIVTDAGDTVTETYGFDCEGVRKH